MSDSKSYWFPMKRYGWGWGLPQVWQGWLVLGVYVALLVGGALVFPPATQPGAFMALAIGASLALVLVCWLKGEPPRWRWGD